MKRVVHLLAASLCAWLASGCGTVPSTEQGDGEAGPFSARSLPEVAFSESVTVQERRYLTGLVPVAFWQGSGDEDRHLFSRVRTAAAMSEVFVARPRMDWVAFGPGGTGKINADLVTAVELAREAGIEDIVIEIDPVAFRRDVGVLPPWLEGMNFADNPVREPITRMALETAIRLHPTYLSIGVEMNGYYEAHPEDFDNYVSLHEETYDAVKAAAPEVRLFATFNLEALQGYFGDLDEFSNHPPQWFLIDKFEPKLDAVGFSTLPFGFFYRTVQLPDDWLTRVELHTTRDILFTEIGWPSSDPSPDDPDSDLYTPQRQAEYLAEMVRQLDQMSQVRIVAWTTLYDADPASLVVVTSAFKGLGLIDFFGNPKPSLDVWKQVYALPYRP